MNFFYSESSEQNSEKTFKYKAYMCSGKHRLNFHQNKQTKFSQEIVITI